MEKKKFRTTPAAWELVQDHLGKIMKNGHEFPDVVRIHDRLDHSRRTFEIDDADLPIFGVILTDLEDQTLDVIKRNWTARHEAYRIKQIQLLLDLVALSNKIFSTFPESDRWK
jgi:hypothetical protein